ncbi:MAG: HDOD domain-containing protein [Gammaproteobacteria bacterium]
MAGSAVPASHSVITSCWRNWSKDDYDVERVSRIICQDPRLSYKLMRVVNSASFGLSRTVKTVEDTIVLLGSYELRRWASMLVLSSVDNKPNELLVTAMVRAKMCELVAKRLHRPNPGSYFTAGLLSLLDALPDRSLADLVSQMPLSAELELALLTGGGDIDQVLQMVAAYDDGRFDAVQMADVDASIMWEVYLESLAWLMWPVTPCSANSLPQQVSAGVDHGLPAGCDQGGGYRLGNQRRPRDFRPADRLSSRRWTPVRQILPASPLAWGVNLDRFSQAGRAGTGVYAYAKPHADQFHCHGQGMAEALLVGGMKRLFRLCRVTFPGIFR